MEFVVALLCMAGIAYILLSHVLLYCIKRLRGVREGRDGGFFCKRSPGLFLGQTPRQRRAQSNEEQQVTAHVDSYRTTQNISPFWVVSLRNTVSG